MELKKFKKILGLSEMLGFDLSDEIEKIFLRMKNVYIKYR